MAERSARRYGSGGMTGDATMAHHEAGTDAAAVRLLQWVFAALLLLNAGALILLSQTRGGAFSPFEEPGWSFAAGLASALGGGLCWRLAWLAMVRERARRAGTPAPEMQESGDLPRTLGALAIMLWVAALTGFLIGSEGLLQSRAEARSRIPLRETASAIRSREAPAPPRLRTAPATADVAVRVPRAPAP